MSELQVIGISKSYAGRKIIDNVSLTLHEGELICLLGVSGSGKTTLFNVISGLVAPDNGEVLLDGEAITSRPGHISYMLQKDLLLPYRTIEDNVALPLLIRGVPTADARRQVSPYFQEFGLDGTHKKYPRQLSAMWHCWMNPFLLWIRSRNQKYIPGI